MWQAKWNENQTVLAAAIHTLDRDACPLKSTVAGSWSLGIVEQSQGKRDLLTVERQIKGMSGRRLWWEMSVEESCHRSIKAIEARQ